MNVNFTQAEEEHEYYSGHNVYDLERGTAIAITRVIGEVDGQSYIFNNSVDYYLVSNQLRWITGGTTPDNLTQFYITYTFRRRIEDVLSDLYTRMRSVYPNSTDSEGTVLRTLLENLAWEFETAYSHANIIKASGYLNTAVGGDLDNVVALLGLLRLTPTKSVGWVSFTRNTTASESYPIPPGTIVSTIGTGRNVPILFETTEAAILPAGDLEVTAPAQALLAGAQGNIAAGAISLLVNDVYGVNGVHNALGFEDGQNSESDTELRTRCRFRLAELAKGTKASIQAIGIGTEGIKDVIVKDYMDTYLTEDVIDPGIAEIMLVGDVPLTTESDAFLNAKEAILSEENKAAGIRCDFFVPTIIYCDIDTEPTLESPIPPGTNVGGIYSSAIENVQNYVNGGYDSFHREQEGLEVGDPLRMNQVIEQFMITTGIVDISPPQIRISYIETFAYTGTATQVLTKTSDAALGNEILSVTGVVGGSPRTFVLGTDYELAQNTIGSVTTLTLTWNSVGNGTRPTNPSDFVVTYRVVDYHTITITDEELLRVANINFYLIIPPACTARSRIPIPTVTTS